MIAKNVKELWEQGASFPFRSKISSFLWFVANRTPILCHIIILNRSITDAEAFCGPASFTLAERLAGMFILGSGIIFNILTLRLASWISPLLRRFMPAYDQPLNAPFKVLHVTCSFDLGGTQRQIMNLIENDSGGALSHDTIEVFPESNYLYRVGEPLEITRYVKGNVLCRALSYLTMYINTRSLYICQIYKLYRDVQAANPAVVVGWGHEIGMLSYIAATLNKTPKIVFCIRTFNPSFGWTNIPKVIEAGHRRMLPVVDGIISNSTLLRDDYSEWLGVKPDIINVCANGISVDTPPNEARIELRRTIRERHNIPADAILILNVGRFSAEKGQMVMALANETLPRLVAGRKVMIMFCGDGPTKEAVEGFVLDRGMENVIFAGRVNDVPAYLCAADIFVMPSDFEGMPNAMMEAMAYGLPCVSTNRTGALDVAREGVEALYIDVGSHEQLAQRLTALLGDEDLMKRLGENASKRILEFSVARMTERFNAVLKKIIMEESGPGR